MRAKWEYPPNPECRQLHVAGPLFEQSSVDFHGHPTEEQRALMDGLCGILGLESFYISTYHVHLMKARVYSWDEVGPRVEQVVSDWCGEPLVMQQPCDWSHVVCD